MSFGLFASPMRGRPAATAPPKIFLATLALWRVHRKVPPLPRAPRVMAAHLSRRLVHPLTPLPATPLSQDGETASPEPELNFDADARADWSGGVAEGDSEACDETSEGQILWVMHYMLLILVVEVFFASTIWLSFILVCGHAPRGSPPNPRRRPCLLVRPARPLLPAEAA